MVTKDSTSDSKVPQLTQPSPATPDASILSSVPVTPSNNQTPELALAPDKTPNREPPKSVKELTKL